MKLLIKFGANARESANQFDVTHPCGHVNPMAITWMFANIYARYT